MKDKIDTVYFCDWLPPDFGAVGQYSLLFAREFAASGQNVVLFGLSSKGHSKTTESLSRGRLEIVRIFTRTYDKTSGIKRVIWTLKTNTRLLFHALKYLKSAKRVIFTGSPPLFLHWVMLSRPLHNARIVYRITDFHPECSIAESGRAGPVLGMLHKLTLFWRRRVDEFEVLGHDQGRRLREIGIADNRIRMKADPVPVTVTPETKPLERPDSFAGKRLLLYSGNWGVAHDVGTFVDGYTAHHRDGSGNTVLWLNAVGKNAARVESLCCRRGLPFHRGYPVPLEQLGSLLVTADAHLITLRNEFVGYVLPSKVHGCVASKKPVLFVGSKNSDVHSLCFEGLGKMYWRADVGEAARVADALEQIARLVPVSSAPVKRVMELNAK